MPSGRAMYVFSIAAWRRIELTQCVWDRVLLIVAFLDVTNVSGQGLYSPSFSASSISSFGPYVQMSPLYPQSSHILHHGA